MSKEFVTPDYDKFLSDDPAEFDIPDDHIQCVRCGEVVHVRGLTCAQNDTECCTDECMRRDIVALRRERALASIKMRLVKDAMREVVALASKTTHEFNADYTRGEIIATAKRYIDW